MKFRSLVVGASIFGGVLTAGAFGTGCGAKVVNVLGANPADGGGDGASASNGDGGGGLPDEDRPLVPASKVDLLLVVDNSASMSDKAALLSKSLGKLIRNVAPVGDVHVGVISTSLGNFGGDVCYDGNPETNGHGWLRTTGPNGTAVVGAESGVLSYTGGDVEAFVANAQALVDGVGQTGCGLEAQLESMYHFLIQPDPWTKVTLSSSNQAQLGDDVDVKVLQQRKAFLRPDSALIVLMLTDEDDSSADPLAVGGQGWAFMAKNFPGSKVLRGSLAQGTTAPRGTSICATDPGNADCTSCGFQAVCDPQDPACLKIRSDAVCKTSGQPGQSGDGYDGYYGSNDDSLNVRFHRMKERYGIDPQYPLSRYVDGLTRSTVPDRTHEHVVENGSVFATVGPYIGTPNCTNPIFAASLPSAVGDELCTLQRGPRSRELVVFAILGGLPPELATDAPNWTQIVGQDPGNYNYTGIDPRMVQSITPRAGRPAPTSSAVDRDWDTQKDDLQYACTFALPQPRTCDPADTSCDCPPDGSRQPPLCSSPGQQTRAKAYPTIRPLRLAQGLGQRGVVGSVCAQTYDDTMTVLSQRLASRLAQ